MSEVRITFTGDPDRLERLAKLAKNWSTIFGTASVEVDFLGEPTYFAVEDIKSFINTQDDASAGIAERTTNTVRNHVGRLDRNGLQNRLGLPEGDTPYNSTGDSVHRHVIGFFAQNYHQIPGMGSKGGDLLARFLVASSAKEGLQE